MNQIMKISPYWKYNTWCFSDDVTGLKDEPFVAGSDRIISELLRSKGILQEAKEGFILTFSGDYFPEYDGMLHHFKTEGSGNWYKTTIGDVEYTGWICPALFLYFSEAPKNIYVKMELNK